tara:strand:+ start:21210 stop:21986 length:777 start_codon:yes stop_codon:yes gene_type:complete
MVFSFANRFVIVLSILTLHLSNSFRLHNSNPFTNVPENVISVSPGGIKGFYYLGTLYYIKKNYDMTKYNYLGASAGSWNSLFMCYKGNNDDEIIEKLFNIDFNQPLAKCGKSIKDLFLKNYKTEDFNLEKLNIGVTQLGKYNKLNLKYTIYNSFIDLEDALDCCLASSHVPFLIGGGAVKRYKNKLAFDGGLKKISYLKPDSSVLHVSSKLWDNEKYITMPGLRKINGFDANALFNDGYNDAKINKKILDDIFKHLHS